MWRVAILKEDGTNEAKTFDTKQQCEEWILQKADKIKLKKALMCDKDNFSDREIINF